MERLKLQVATVAHELNNILTVVRTYTHFAREPSSAEQYARDLRIVAAAAERGTTLTDWLALATEHEQHAQDIISGKHLLSAVSVRLQLLALPGTLIETVPASEDLAIRGNYARLKHVLISLVLSVNQLLPGGAFKLGFERKLIEAEHSPPHEPTASAVIVVHCLATEQTPELGIDSVKEGLASLISLVSDLLGGMNGALSVKPGEPGVVRFELSLPAVSTTAVSASPGNARVPAHGRIILVVEDDAAIRLAMQRTLISAGHSVLEASDDPSARQILSEFGQNVSLVVSDDVLPRGSGPDLFAWLSVRYAGVAFLLTSGRGREGGTKAKQLGVGFLGKPFYPAELLSAVNQALSTARTNEAALLGTSTERPVVVFVDDDSDIRDSFGRLLGECNLETHLARSALHALQIMSERHVDAVITDQVMPGLDGIGLLEVVSARFPGCARVLCTGHPGSDVVVTAVNRQQVHRVLTKTMHAVALRDEIQRVVLETVRAPVPSGGIAPEQTSSRHQ